jgi:hypothetical protein
LFPGNAGSLPEGSKSFGSHLASLLINLGMPDFDASVLQRSESRCLTQAASNIVYSKEFNGIRYLSKYGHEIENLALFEPADLSDQLHHDIQPDDADLLEAFRIFHLTLS